LSWSQLHRGSRGVRWDSASLSYRWYRNDEFGVSVPQTTVSRLGRSYWIRGTLVLGVATLANCSSPSEPSSQGPPAPYLPEPTVLITNPTCDSDGCELLYIGMFAWKWLHYAPVPPWGGRFGTVEGPETCLRFPGLDTLRVHRVDSLGNVVHTREYYWRPDDPEGVFLVVGYTQMTETFIPLHSCRCARMEAHPCRQCVEQEAVHAVL
jgi:hypothetical protein